MSKKRIVAHQKAFVLRKGSGGKIKRVRTKKRKFAYVRKSRGKGKPKFYRQRTTFDILDKNMQILGTKSAKPKKLKAYKRLKK